MTSKISTPSHGYEPLNMLVNDYLVWSRLFHHDCKYARAMGEDVQIVQHEVDVYERAPHLRSWQSNLCNRS
jgi:hypothetical protein